MEEKFNFGSEIFVKEKGELWIDVFYSISKRLTRGKKPLFMEALTEFQDDGTIPSGIVDMFYKSAFIVFIKTFIKALMQIYRFCLLTMFMTKMLKKIVINLLSTNLKNVVKEKKQDKMSSVSVLYLVKILRLTAKNGINLY